MSFEKLSVQSIFQATRPLWADRPLWANRGDCFPGRCGRTGAVGAGRLFSRPLWADRSSWIVLLGSGGEGEG